VSSVFICLSKFLSLGMKKTKTAKIRINFAARARFHPSLGMGTILTVGEHRCIWSTLRKGGKHAVMVELVFSNTG